MDEHEIPLVADLREHIVEAGDVPSDERSDDGIDDGGRETLVLEDLREDLAREGHLDVRCFGLENLPHPLLVRRVGVGVDEADRDSRDAPLLEDPCAGARFLFVESHEDVAPVVDPFGDAQPIAPQDVRRRDVA